jgi:hypothetical protein
MNKLLNAINDKNIDLIIYYSKKINVDFYSTTEIIINAIKTEDLDIIKIIFEIKDIQEIITIDIVVKIIQLENIELLNLLFDNFNIISTCKYILDINKFYNFTCNINTINCIKIYINSYKN